MYAMTEHWIPYTLVFPGHSTTCIIVYVKVSHCFGVSVGALTGSSGGGHGGSGGRGKGNAKVGLAFDSIFAPTEYGGSGGYGEQRGM